MSMSAPDKPVDVAALWQAEANWAVSEWRAQFEPEQRRLKSSAGGLNSSGTWVQIGDAAKRYFETLQDELLKRVRDVLATRNDSDHIGPADHAAAEIAGPLIRCALESVQKTESAAMQRGFLSPGMVTGPLSKTRAEIQQAGNKLQSALRSEITIRLAQIESAKKLAVAAREAAAPKAKPETGMQRVYRWITVARTYAWLIGIIFTAGLWAWSGFPLSF